MSGPLDHSAMTWLTLHHNHFCYFPFIHAFLKDEKDEVIATNVWIRQVTAFQSNQQYI